MNRVDPATPQNSREPTRKDREQQEALGARARRSEAGCAETSRSSVSTNSDS